MLMGCRVTQYAIRDRSVTFRGRTNLYVDGKELRAVPRLAIGEGRTGECVLFHCGRTWKVRGAESYATLSELKHSAERVYPGIRANWRQTNVTKRQAAAYRKRVWRGLECSFCGRLPDEFERLFGKRNARICDDCIRGFNRLLKTRSGRLTQNPKTATRGTRR
jgi:hypothetical protein